ncbi:hypothetical protein, partial [Baaleninema sp.]|uniref:hypothetical protein n=1 Tax=Baaleninema sp. TaxID=3101197 RepID=UPI003D041953
DSSKPYAVSFSLLFSKPYFSFFQLEVTTLSLPAESFYIAAFQVFFGSPRAVLFTILATLTTAVGIYATLWFLEDRLFNSLQRAAKKLRRALQNALKHRLAQPKPKQNEGFKLTDFLYRGGLGLIKSFVGFRILEYQSLRFLHSLFDEIVILCWVLTALFWLAQWQGEADAWRDAVNETSSLPVVAVVVRENGFPLGENPEKPYNPTGIRIIGDKDTFNGILGGAVNNPEKDLVWRLLIDIDGDYYIFPALPDDAESDLRPPVVVVPRSQNGDRLILLRPMTDEDRVEESES